MKLIGLILVLLTFSTSARAADIRFTGFGDLSFGTRWGGPAKQGAADNFEALGTDPFPTNVIQGFGVAGIDSVLLADLDESVTVIAEVNLQVARGSTSDFELDVERLFLDYKIVAPFNVQAGLFFTPIGFENRNHYARAYLQHAARVPGFFEEENNFIPTHTIGINGYGALSFGEHAVEYQVSVGNGRLDTPVDAAYARDPYDKDFEFAGVVEWVAPYLKQLRIGVSGWTNVVNSYRLGLGESLVSIADPTAVKMRLRDIGVNPYAIVSTQYFFASVEYVRSSMKDLKGNLPKERYNFDGLLAEVALNLMDQRLHPFVRYDMAIVPKDGGPYYGLRGSEEGGLARLYIPSERAIMAGVAYDLTLGNRIKAQYSFDFIGPREVHGVTVQSAFAF